MTRSQWLGVTVLAALFATEAKADTVVSGLWSKAGSPSHYEHGLDSREAFRDHDEEQRNEGRRLVDIEEYANADGKRRWAGLWEAGSGAQQLELQLGETKLEQLIDTHASNGLRLVDLETYMTRRPPESTRRDRGERARRARATRPTRATSATVSSGIARATIASRGAR